MIAFLLVSVSRAAADRHALQQYLQAKNCPAFWQPTVAQRFGRSGERSTASQTTKPLAVELVPAVFLRGCVLANEHARIVNGMAEFVNILVDRLCGLEKIAQRFL